MAEFFDDCPSVEGKFPHPGLHVHRRDNSTGVLVVFVHGWGGGGYATWRDIPAAVYQAEPGADVALFDYVSGKRRLKTESPSLDGTVDYLVDELQALASTYSAFVLIGHSMGGVVCAATLRRSRELGHAVHQHTIGLLSIASPRAGIRRIPFAARPIKDSMFLAAHADVHRRNFEFFNNFVDIGFHVGQTKPFHIPHNVAVASYDRVVNLMTSSGDLPKSHVDRFLADHTGILGLPDVTKWVLKNLTKFVAIRAEELRSSKSRTLVTRFKGHSLHGEWQDAYKAALLEFSDREKVLVYDDTSRMASDAVGLMVRVVRCEDVGTPELEDDLRGFAELHDRSAIASLGISPFGQNLAPCERQILEMVGDANNRWIRGVGSTRALRSEIVRWLSRLHPPHEAPGYVHSSEPVVRFSRAQGLGDGLGLERGVFHD